MGILSSLSRKEKSQKQQANDSGQTRSVGGIDIKPARESFHELAIKLAGLLQLEIEITENFNLSDLSISDKQLSRDPDIKSTQQLFNFILCVYKLLTVLPDQAKSIALLMHPRLVARLGQRSTHCYPENFYDTCYTRYQSIRYQAAQFVLQQVDRLDGVLNQSNAQDEKNTLQTWLNHLKYLEEHLIETGDLEKNIRVKCEELLSCVEQKKKILDEIKAWLGDANSNLFSLDRLDNLQQSLQVTHVGNLKGSKNILLQKFNELPQNYQKKGVIEGTWRPEFNTLSGCVSSIEREVADEFLADLQKQDISSSIILIIIGNYRTYNNKLSFLFEKCDRQNSTAVKNTCSEINAMLQKEEDEFSGLEHANLTREAMAIVERLRNEFVEKCTSALETLKESSLDENNADFVSEPMLVVSTPTEESQCNDAQPPTPAQLSPQVYNDIEKINPSRQDVGDKLRAIAEERQTVEAAIAECGEQINTLQQQHYDLDQTIQSQRDEAAVLSKTYEEKSRQIMELSDNIKQLEKKLNENTQRIAAIEDGIANIEKNNNQEALTYLTETAEMLEEKIKSDAIHQSTTLGKLKKLTRQSTPATQLRKALRKRNSKVYNEHETYITAHQFGEFNDAIQSKRWQDAKTFVDTRLNTISSIIENKVNLETESTALQETVEQNQQVLRKYHDEKTQLDHECISLQEKQQAISTDQNESKQADVTAQLEAVTKTKAIHTKKISELEAEEASLSAIQSACDQIQILPLEQEIPREEMNETIEPDPPWADIIYIPAADDSQIPSTQQVVLPTNSYAGDVADMSEPYTEDMQIKSPIETEKPVEPEPQRGKLDAVFSRFVEYYEEDLVKKGCFFLYESVRRKQKKIAAKKIKELKDKGQLTAQNINQVEKDNPLMRATLRDEMVWAFKNFVCCCAPFKISDKRADENGSRFAQKLKKIRQCVN